MITYEFDEAALSSELNVKVFPERASVEWFLFIFANRDRSNSDFAHNYDIVVGPIADDGVVLQLTNYKDGIYTPEEASRLLQDRFLDQQYYFSSERALRFLHKIKSEKL